MGWIHGGIILHWRPFASMPVNSAKYSNIAACWNTSDLAISQEVHQMSSADRLKVATPCRNLSSLKASDSCPA